MRRRCSQNDMRIRSPKAKGVDACDPLLGAIREGLDLRRHAQLELLEIDVRARYFKMKAGGNLTVLQDQHCFEQPGDPCSSFEVTKIGFYRANRERLIGSTAYVRALVGKNAVGLIATHDLELAHLAEGQPLLHNYHFEERVEGGRLIRSGKHYPCPEERDFFDAIGQPWVEPAERSADKVRIAA